MANLLQMSGVIVDLIYQVRQVPEAGCEANVSACSVHAGGGFNAMVAARQSGMTVQYASGLGTGLFANIVGEALLHNHIEILQTPQPEHDQGSCVVLVDEQGERTFIAKSGADGHSSIDKLQHIRPGHRDWVLVSGYILAYENSRDAMAQWIGQLDDHVTLVFDPSPLVDQIPQDILATVLARANWISANEREAQQLTQRERAVEAAQSLWQKSSAHLQGVLVRLGAQGCFLATASIERTIAGYPVNSIDTNGAGDAHLGAFIASMADGESAEQSAIFANACAALATTKQGPATSPTRNEVQQFLAQHRAL